MNVKPREGDIYDVVHVGGHSFVIRYGFYQDSERGVSDPIPIFPCFLTTPVHTGEGMPLVTRIQDACEHYTAIQGEGDGWCADCVHCQNWQTEIGICQCTHRRKQPPQDTTLTQPQTYPGRNTL